jgi:hypothetical protein
VKKICDIVRELPRGSHLLEGDTWLSQSSLEERNGKEKVLNSKVDELIIQLTICSIIKFYFGIKTIQILWSDGNVVKSKQNFILFLWTSPLFVLLWIWSFSTTDANPLMRRVLLARCWLRTTTGTGKKTL